MTLTHLRSAPPGSRGYCRGLWKAQAAAGFRPILLGDAAHLEEALGQPPAPYVHLVKVSSHAAFLGDVLREAALPNDTLVVYHDALDVLALGGPAPLFDCLSAAWCARRMAPQRGVYFLGERSLWPPSCRYVDAGRSWCNDHPELAPLPLYPNLTEPGGSPDYAFINSGMYAGSPPALHAMLAAALAQSAATGSGDDQELFNDLATNFPPWRAHFQLDTRQVCFGSAHRSGEHYSREPASGRWRNALTGGAPLLMHFNGGGKEWMPAAVEAAAGVAEEWGGAQLAPARLLLWGTGLATSRDAPMSEVCGAEGAAGPGGRAAQEGAPQ